MAAEDEPPRKSIVVDDAMLRAFAKGQLDEATEDRIVALLEQRPELQDKVAAISTDGILSKMKAHREVLASKSLSSQIGVGSSVNQTQQVSAQGTAQPNAPIDLPAELFELTDYRIIKELGRGGMGVVYLAEHTLTGRKEVLKVLNERLMNHSEAKKRFEQEIRCIASVDHDAIVRCYTVRMMPRTIVLAMEHVPGSDLHQFIARNGRLPLHIACGITTEVCSGLQHAMGVGLVHRDIKPSNIMVYKADGRLRAKILDFGLGRPAESNSGTGLTQDGTLLGTLEYVSPEQSMDANKVDIRSDIYSLGCTLYHMLIGHPPFSGSQGELIMAHAQKTPPSINLIHPELPVELADVVARMMAKEPSRRYATPRDVAVALKPFLSRKRGETAAPSLGMTGAPETHRPIAAEVDTSVEAGSRKQQPTATAATGAPRFVVEAGKLGSNRVDSPAPKTLVVAQLVPQRSRGRKSKPRNPLHAVALWLVASSALVAAILGIIQIRTSTGTIVIENLPADAEVLVDGENVSINWDGQHATVTAKPGERMVEVKQGDLAIEGERVVVRSGHSITFSISREINTESVSPEYQRTATLPPNGSAQLRNDQHLQDLRWSKVDGVAKDAEKWFVIFRSDDPKVWNQEFDEGEDNFAKPISEAPRNLKYLKLSQVPGDFVIIPMTFDGLEKSHFDNRRYSWVGTNVNKFNGYHLGIVDNELFGQRGTQYVILRDQYTDPHPEASWRRGWGFGHVHLRNSQGWAWAGEKIEKTVIDISVTQFELSQEESQRLLE